MRHAYHVPGVNFNKYGMRDLINIVESPEDEGPEGYPHWLVNDEIIRLAGKYQGNSMGAANYAYVCRSGDEDALVKHYEKTILPILQNHHFPTPPAGPAASGTDEWRAFLKDVRDYWITEERL